MGETQLESAHALTCLRDGKKNSPVANITKNNSKEEIKSHDNTTAKSPFDADAPKSFPCKIMEILSKNEHAHIIAWLPHGRGFMIHDTRQFTSEILPFYFESCKWHSFTRQLHQWGFIGVPVDNTEDSAYYLHHNNFQRDNTHLCKLMSCRADVSFGTQMNNNPISKPASPGRKRPRETFLDPASSCLKRPRHTSYSACRSEYLQMNMSPKLPKMLSYSMISNQVIRSALAALQRSNMNDVRMRSVIPTFKMGDACSLLGRERLNLTKAVGVLKLYPKISNAHAA